MDTEQNRDNLAQSDEQIIARVDEFMDIFGLKRKSDVEMNATSVPTQSIGSDEGGEIVTCAECGDEFDNTTDGYFFPIGDCATMPEQYTEKHYCDDCGGEIAMQHGWFSNRKQRPSIGDAIRKHAEPVPPAVPDEPQLVAGLPSSVVFLVDAQKCKCYVPDIVEEQDEEYPFNNYLYCYNCDEVLPEGFLSVRDRLVALEADLANARTTIDTLVPTLIDTGKQQAEKIAALQAENARLVAALQEIANEKPIKEADAFFYLIAKPETVVRYVFAEMAEKALKPATPIGVTDGAQ